MKNITVTIDDGTYRRARVEAAMRGTSVSALVRGFLTELAPAESESDRLRREEVRLKALITDFSAADRLSRESIHARR